jgi:hypothetical protein
MFFKLFRYTYTCAENKQSVCQPKSRTNHSLFSEQCLVSKIGSLDCLRAKPCDPPLLALLCAKKTDGADRLSRPHRAICSLDSPKLGAKEDNHKSISNEGERLTASRVDALEKKMDELTLSMVSIQNAERVCERIFHVEQIIIAHLRQTESVIKARQNQDTVKTDFSAKNVESQYFCVNSVPVVIKTFTPDKNTTVDNANRKICKNEAQVNLSMIPHIENMCKLQDNLKSNVPKPNSEKKSCNSESFQRDDFMSDVSLICRNSIITEYNNLSRRKSTLFEELQNSFFLDTMRKDNTQLVERFDLREVYQTCSNNILTDLDGCFLSRDKESGKPVIYILESKTRFDKIKIDQKIIQICKFQRSLHEYMTVGALASCSKKFMQMIKKYNLLDNFRGLDFRLVFSYQFIDKHCIEYLECINNGTIETCYDDLTLKMFSFNNNYIFLTKKYPHLLSAKNLSEFRLLVSSENLAFFSVSAIEKFLVEYQYLAEYMECMKSKIGFMNTNYISINGTNLDTQRKRESTAPGISAK